MVTIIKLLTSGYVPNDSCKLHQVYYPELVHTSIREYCIIFYMGLKLQTGVDIVRIIHLT